MKFVHLVLFLLSVISPIMTPNPGAASEPGVRTVFAGKIIRALSVDPTNASRILVGLKGQAPGSAKVFESLDQGRSWRGLNEGRSLSAQASDVQAVASIGREVVFAGTWKHGLFISRNGGMRFERQARFSSSDIRYFLVRTEGTSKVIYAATARDGVFRSRDEGRTWEPLGPGRDFIWSLSASRDSSSLYAVSLEKSIHRLARKTGSWDKIFDLDDAYGLAVGYAGSRLAIAAQTGAYLSGDAGATWRRVALPGREKLSSALYLDNGHPIFGSWSDGLIRVDPGTGSLHRYLPKNAGASTGVRRQLPLSGNLGGRAEDRGNRLRHAMMGRWTPILLPIVLVMILFFPSMEREALGRPAKTIPLLTATLDGALATVKNLLGAGVDPDLHDDYRNTALIYAARDGKTEIARALLSAGASPGWVDGERVTPLILAAFKGHIEIVKLLLAHKVDRGHRDQWGRTASDYALRRGDADSVAIRLRTP